MSDHDPQDIREKVLISDVARKLLTDREPNSRGFMLCPFHEERSPSFKLRPESNRAHCFGCGWNGGVIDLVMDLLGLGLGDALDWCANLAGLEAPSPVALKPPKVASRRPDDPPRPLRVSDKEQQHTASATMVGLFSGVTPTTPLHAYCDRRRWSWTGLRELAKGRSLGCDSAGTMLQFNFEYGTKIRGDVETSRSSRWVVGKARHCCWCIEQLRATHRDVYIFEGETDLINAYCARAPRSWESYIAIPGASWRPSAAMAVRIARRRRVFLALDNDSAGSTATKALGDGFAAAGAAAMFRFDWRLFDEGFDIGDLSPLPLLNLFEDNWTPITPTH